MHRLSLVPGMGGALALTGAMLLTGCSQSGDGLSALGPNEAKAAGGTPLDQQIME